MCYPDTPFTVVSGANGFISSVSLGSISDVTGLNPPPVCIIYTNLSTGINTREVITV
ncbi:MAG: hypothetical protein IPP71_24030 [Bacteroidetes bacterium]|nr:hypothetical protein [Bacteroidota bacterium]